MLDREWHLLDDAQLACLRAGKQRLRPATRRTLQAETGFTALDSARLRKAITQTFTTERTRVSWASYNKPSRITGDGATETFTYGPDRSRLVTAITKGSDTVTTTYIDGLFEQVYDSATGDLTYKHYILAGGIPVGVETITANSRGTETSDTLSFYVRDEVGSVIATVTEGLGGTNQKFAVTGYDAWGKAEATSGTAAYQDPPPGMFFSPTPQGQNQGYAGHDNLNDTGLVDMEGRVYDPEVGVFLSADPNVQNPFSSQGYDRYIYVNDNPLSLNDPSGYFSLAGFVFGGVFGAEDPVLFGQITQTFAPLLNLVPYCQYWCAASAEMVGGYLSSGGDIKAGVYAAVLTEVSGNFGPALTTSSGAINWTAVGYQIANSAVGAVDPQAAAAMALIEGGYDSYSTDGLTGLRKYTEHQIVTYAARNEEVRIAEHNGMSPFELDAELTVISVAGDYVVGSRYDPRTRHFVGFDNRYGLLGVPFDVIDSMLAVQGLPTGSLYGQIADDIWDHTSGPVTGFSLGAYDANNSVALRFSPSAKVQALPIFGTASAGVSAQQGSNDAIIGFEILSRLFNPTESYETLQPAASWLPIVGAHSQKSYSCTFQGVGCGN